VLTYRQLDDRSNRVARLLRAAGLRRGDHMAVLLANRPEWYEVVWGALRAGLYVTPVNFHLTAAEAGYIVADCGARALVVDADLAATVAAMGPDLAGMSTRLVVGSTGRGPDDRPGLEGFEGYEAALAAPPPLPIDDQCEGGWMFYSSGPTGRPKGIEPPLPKGPLGAPTPFGALLSGLYRITPDTVYLSPAPLYHAGPAGWTTLVQRFGGTAVLMGPFDAAEGLA